MSVVGIVTGNRITISEATAAGVQVCIGSHVGTAYVYVVGTLGIPMAKGVEMAFLIGSK